MKELLNYLTDIYAPVGMIVYGSWSDGTQNAESDFDALLLCKDGEYRHDTSFVKGVQLDVFVYPVNSIVQRVNPDEFLQIYDGTVVLDKTGVASGLKEQVRNYVASHPKKTPEEKAELVNWCRKMLHRASRSDEEGMFRSHWLLVDSLMIYCDIRDQFYFGPKKTIRTMEEKDPEGFLLFSDALQNQKSLSKWIDYVIKE